MSAFIFMYSIRDNVFEFDAWDNKERDDDWTKEGCSEANIYRLEDKVR